MDRDEKLGYEQDRWHYFFFTSEYTDSRAFEIGGGEVDLFASWLLKFSTEYIISSVLFDELSE